MRSGAAARAAGILENASMFAQKTGSKNRAADGMVLTRSGIGLDAMDFRSVEHSSELKIRG